MDYDDDGNPQTTTLEEYLLPGILDVPEVEMVEMVSASPHNPIGVKAQARRDDPRRRGDHFVDRERARSIWRADLAAAHHGPADRRTDHRRAAQTERGGDRIIIEPMET